MQNKYSVSFFIVSLAAIVLIFVGYFPKTSYAQGPNVSIGNVTTCTAGSVVTVPITVQNFTDIGAVSLDLLYDSTKLTYTGNNSSVLTGNLIVNNPTVGGVTYGRVLISWFSLTSSNVGNGLLMNLTFTANGSTNIN